MAKLRDYALNPDHPEGAGKARAFATWLGLTVDHAAELEEALLAAVVTHDADEVRMREDGTSYAIRFALTGPDGRRALCVAAWFVPDTEDEAPRLATVYLERPLP